MIPLPKPGKPQPLALACAWTLSALLVGGLEGCTGSSSSSPTPAPTADTGIWTARYENSGQHLLIVPDADGHFRNLSDGDLSQIAGTGTVTGNTANGGGFYFPSAVAAAKGSTVEPATLAAQITAQSTFSAALGIGAETLGPITYTYDAADNTETALTDLVGDYLAVPTSTSSNFATAISIQVANVAGSSAILSGSDEQGKTLTGSLTQVEGEAAAGLNAFSVNCTLNPNVPGQQPEVFNGLAYLDKNTATPTLVFMSDNTALFSSQSATQLSAFFTKVTAPTTAPTPVSALANAYTGTYGGQQVKGLVFSNGSFIFGNPQTGQVQYGTLGTGSSGSATLIGSGVNTVTPAQLAAGDSAVPFFLQAVPAPGAANTFYSFSYPSSGGPGVQATTLAVDSSLLVFDFTMLPTVGSSFLIYDDSSQTFFSASFTSINSVGASASFIATDKAGDALSGTVSLLNSAPSALTATLSYLASGSKTPVSYAGVAYMVVGAGGDPSLILMGYDTASGLGLYGSVPLSQ